MASWRDLVAQNTEQVRQDRANNPGVQSLGAVLKMAVQSGMSKRQAATEQGYKEKNIALQSAYQQNPGLAAQALGMDPGTQPGGAGQMPPGMQPYETTVSGSGEVTSKYRAPKVIDAPTLLGLYNDYMTQVQKANSQVIPTLGQEPIQIPSYRDWVNQNFPEYSHLVGSGGMMLDEEDIMAMKPADVPQDRWLAASDSQRRALLKSRDMLNE